MYEVNSEKNPEKTISFCVIIPTYNNHKTLTRVINSVLEQSSNIIIVNDGSTDSTKQIIDSYPNIHSIHFPINKGKGVALSEGLNKARSLNFDYAITIDSDGQHFPSDIPKFINEINKNGESLIIGSRNMTHADIPKKSSFGNKFSNFWFWFETTIKLSDTQSGFRLYPINKIPKKYFTTKFEFEIEIIVRSAWKGITIKNIPINILYDPKERVSHFRPFKDFTRISILNTILVLIALFYIKPRDIILSFKKKNIKQFILENILQSKDSNLKKSFSIALGVFIGISPFWGFQTLLVLVLSSILKLNKVISFAFSNISFPPLIPVLVYGSLKLGGLFIHSDKLPIYSTSLTFSDIQSNLNQYIVGSFILALLSAILFGISGFLVLSIFDRISKNKIA
jgi:glycosyltransferase involved in cell wall biosynthesis